jgi:uncharacterized membrane protein HdeD (DUF308 family)
MEEFNNSEQNNLGKTNENNVGKVTEQKPSIFILLLGLFLIVRGVMRLSEGELGTFGILMMVIGAANIIYYIAKRI